MKSIRQCLMSIKKAHSIAIITHTMPDADALASSVALSKLIQTNMLKKGEQKIIDILVDAKEINDVDQAILHGQTINKKHAKVYDLAIAIDCASLQRLGKYAKVFNAALSTINIDHHATNTEFAQNNLVLKTSSACEVLYIFAKMQQLEMPDDICKLIYSGIITDTNNLTQGTITVETHKIIAEFAEREIDLQSIHDHFFKNNTKSKTFLLKQALSTLTFMFDDRMTFMKLTKQNIADCKATYEDTYGIVDFGINIKGVELAVLAIKQADNSYYVSLRGKHDINVAHIAIAMNGGGHEKIAAFQYKGYLADLKQKLFEECQKELTAHPQKDVFGNLFTSNTNLDDVQVEE